MNHKKIFVIIIFFIASLLSLFYFWAQSPQFDEQDYNHIDYFSKSLNTSKDTIRVLSYNLGYLSGMSNNKAEELPESLVRGHLKKAQSLISGCNLDIAAFQEIDFYSKRSYFINQYEEIAKGASFANGAMAVNWDKHYVPFPYWPMKYHFGSLYSGQALLSEFEIISNEIIVLQKPESNTFIYNAFYLERLAQCVWLRNGLDSLLVINVHFEAWEQETREIQAQTLIEEYQQYEADYPIIMLGDFNCSPPFDPKTNEQTIGKLLNVPSLKMVSNEESYLQNPNHFYTFDSHQPSEKIDYIFYNDRFMDRIDSKVAFDAGEISDHLPLFATLVYKDY